MRISLVLLLCFVIAVVNAANTKSTRRRVVTSAGQNTTKGPVPKSAYAYLRTVRGNSSCSSGTCPFWERHGRSFAALRCYSQQYQECTCLHRMCFSSCMFSREVCNTEMASCLRQICPRCMPPSAKAMCSVYDSMADQVATALSVFACYPCCPNMNNIPINNSGQQSNSVTATTTIPAVPTTMPSNIINDVFNNQSPGQENIEGEFPGNDYPTDAGEGNNSGSNSIGDFYPFNNGNTGEYNTGNNIPNGATNGGNIPNGGTTGNFNNVNFPNGGNNGNLNSGNIPNGGTTGNFNNVNFPNGGTNGNLNSGNIPNGGTTGNFNNVNFPNGGINGNLNEGDLPNGVFNGNSNGVNSPNGVINGNPNGVNSPNGGINGNQNGINSANGGNNGNQNGINSANGGNNGNQNVNVSPNRPANSSPGNGINVNCNTHNSYAGVIYPGGDAVFYNNTPVRSQQGLKQRARQTLRTTLRRASTTRRTPAATRPLAQGTATNRNNKVNRGVRKPVQKQKKPQTNSSIQS